MAKKKINVDNVNKEVRLSVRNCFTGIGSRGIRGKRGLTRSVAVTMRNNCRNPIVRSVQPSDNRLLLMS